MKSLLSLVALTYASNEEPCFPCKETNEVSCDCSGMKFGFSNFTAKVFRTSIFHKKSINFFLTLFSKTNVLEISEYFEKFSKCESRLYGLKFDWNIEKTWIKWGKNFERELQKINPPSWFTKNDQPNALDLNLNNNEVGEIKENWVVIC